MSNKSKIFLSTPHLGNLETSYIEEAIKSNWIAPVGDNLDGFENDLKKYLGGNHEITTLNSGTAAIHLALRLLGVSAGDEVICQSFTFIATANPILYLRATPVFVDSELETWNMCPKLLEVAIKNRINNNKKPKAIIVVDLYGMPYHVDEINAVAKKYDIPVLEDSAEALGSHVNNKYCGTLSEMGVFSFNGNKMITTSAGGALVTSSEALKNKSLFLATQAKENKSYYEHVEMGYNYRMSNVLAGIGRGQMAVLNERIQSRRANFEFYKETLQFKGVSFLDEPKDFFSNRWLTCISVNSFEIREKIRLNLLKENIESKPLWKPLHTQPIFKENLSFLNGNSEALFETGLCLPSGSNLSKTDLNRVCDVVLKSLG
ncbi:DegT/DnrJ/EryC1/StrS family aminotransferase [Siansivirga zeaxanthinifaciens]|uniref:Pyridoxal phosphate-dependent aminotransferase n=1 Tax=Siansivirga zeaxanthinifaciens CC-SAMT-1 TaxID=1454006 RepID=A0A0C5WB11_9FLAO|nr:DegT/DnrJ/EryC1/StrS family aminotransferase [Siansivirga zeaxanthinifaciens]AJR04283.1 pyridoxal phosphate-dependent aminotransferase [Siansivirga zeaxanthinifaciens CC-SAMT-1]